MKMTEAKNNIYLKINRIEFLLQPYLIANAYVRYQKMKFRMQFYIDIWKIIPYLQVNPYWLKTKNISSLIALGT